MHPNRITYFLPGPTRCLLAFFMAAIFTVSCTKKRPPVDIAEFSPVSNFSTASDSVILLEADLTNSPLYGVEIPSKKQTPSGMFVFRCKVKNNKIKDQKLYYKIYYQNESYKFAENSSYADENFYGSWEDVGIGFKQLPDLKTGEETQLVDSFRILGNPRDEKIYYGADPEKFRITDELISSKMQMIKGSPEWMKQIGAKAEKGKLPVDEMVFLDALWSINYDKANDTTANNRWKRNPRAGKYRFMLVIAAEEDLNRIPEHVRQIGKKDGAGKFVDPFGYFLEGEGKKLKNTFAAIAPSKLQVKFKFDLGAGIYINRTSVNKSAINKNSYNSRCGDAENLYRHAQFQQYFHYINKDFPLHNIPEIRDVIGENFSKKEYEELKKKYENSPQLVTTYVNSTDCPCKTVKSDSIARQIMLVNPASEPGALKKEHVGVMSRVGFTYGKWRAKIKFPELINRENVWNGITNAFWLLYQDESPWNKRRICDAEVAYIPKYEPDIPASLKKSQKVNNYSEIDFEIIKESRYWPKTSYGGREDYPREDASLNDDVMIACTNWDLACHEPKNFSIGAKEFTIDGVTEVLHRWDHFYKALSTKIPAKDDELFKSDYYYFEIDWQPDKIIWRVGPEKNNMRAICVMDKDISAIPGNQMIMIVTQEWHSQEWWPTAPFMQNFVPFPKKDIVGKILEVEIE